MSVKIVRKVLSRAIRRVILTLIGWFILIPIATLIPRKKKSIVFMGKNGGLLIDNVKYLYFYLNDLNLINHQIHFLTKNKEVYSELMRKNFSVLMHPSISSYFKLLRAEVVIVDSDISISTFYMIFYSKKIQLWHGVGFKRIAVDNLNEIKEISSPVLARFYKSSKFYPEYDLLGSTSAFYTENVFKKAIKAKEYLNTGYSRNDIMFRSESELDLLGADLESILKVKAYKKSGYKIILYTPTFRDSGGGPIDDAAINIFELNHFAEKYKCLFVIKFHPSCRNIQGIEKTANIISYNKIKDIYPLFSLADLMITDYSSIYMDFILQDKPVIFFSYDYQKYIKEDRDIQFDYDWITPGPKCYSQAELQSEILKLINGNDDYIDKRHEIIKMAFEHRDGNASQRIWNYIQEHYL